MRPATLLLGIVVAAATVSAQQSISLWPNRAGFFSRGTLGTGWGEVLQGFHGKIYSGLGEANGKCEIKGLSVVVQDQDAASQESFYWIVRHGDDSKGPSRAAADQILGVMSMKTPQGVGKKAWRVFSALSQPAKIKDCTRHMSVGVHLNLASSFPSDGLAVQAEQQSFQNSHSRQEDHAWGFVGSATVATHPSHKRTYNVALLLDSVVMQLHNGNNSNGMGGIFPKEGQPLYASVRGGSNLGGAAGFVVLSTKPFQITGIPLGLGARVYLSPSYHFFAITANSGGEANFKLLSAVPSAYAGVGTFNLQSLYIKNGIYYFSNSHAVIP